MKKKLLLFQFVLASICSIAQTTLPATLSCNEKLTLAGSPYIVNNTITIKKGCQLTIDPGVEIRMAANTYLNIKGKADFLGTAAKPIWIHSKGVGIDSTWGNILLDTSLNSTFNYVIIENARLPLAVNREPGAIYGFHSSFTVKNCVFKNNLRCIAMYDCPNMLIKDNIMDSTNLGEKVLCQYCDNAVFEGNTLYYTHGDRDAVDFDASKNIRISNNNILGGDDDGIDIGQCDSIGCDGVTIEGNYIVNMGNKGVSNGERCKNIKINRNLIVDCTLGIGAKSGAVVKADHNTLVGNRLGIMSYDHLDQIWGPGNLTVTNSIITGGDTIWWVDPTAFLSVSYSLSGDTLLPGIGNIEADPKFVSATNFHLTSTSPAIDKGDPIFANDPNGTRSDIGRFYFGDPTGIQSNKISDQVSVYPNPSNGNFTINLTPNNEVNYLTIQNGLGQILKKEAFFGNKMEHSVDFSSQAPGIYYLQVVSENTSSIKKFIIQ